MPLPPAAGVTITYRPPSAGRLSTQYGAPSATCRSSSAIAERARSAAEIGERQVPKGALTGMSCSDQQSMRSGSVAHRFTGLVAEVARPQPLARPRIDLDALAVPVVSRDDAVAGLLEQAHG